MLGRFILAVVIAGAGVFQITAQTSPQDETLATVNGERISETDLGINGQLLRLEQQAYQLRLRAVENAINRKLLEQAARQRALSVEEFLKREVDSEVPEPTAGEVEAFYLALKDKFNQPLDQVRQQVTAQLKFRRSNEAREALVRRLREKAKVQISLQPPRIQVDVAGAPRKGPATAPVVIVEFSDFQCPYCRQAQSTLKHILSKYGDQVSLVFRDLPLNIHPQAQPAAEAARCAQEQGKFWAYHDELFQAAQLGPELYPQIAVKLGLDKAAFQSCMESGEFRDAVQRDMQYAFTLGASSTPSFFINGVPLSGAQPLGAFTSVIEAELARARRSN